MTNAKPLTLVAATLFLAPMAYAHVDGGLYGTPKPYCEDSPLAGDQSTHDYGPPAAGFLILLGTDWSTPSGAYPLLPGGCAYAGDVPNQWDGHYDYALGGAWLLACEASCGDGTGGGSLACFGTYADHSEFPVVWAFDHALSTLGADVPFSVYSDTLDNVPDPTGTEPACGDFESDFGADCVNHCAIGFPASQDGSYQVYVAGTAGHVWTQDVAPPPPPPPAPSGLILVYQTPGQEPVVLTPPDWSCGDPTIVTEIDGMGVWVECDAPNPSMTCDTLTADGFGTGSGTMEVKTGCGLDFTTTGEFPLDTNTRFSPTISAGAGPWVCAVLLKNVNAEAEWCGHCRVNVQ